MITQFIQEHCMVYCEYNIRLLIPEFQNEHSKYCDKVYSISDQPKYTNQVIRHIDKTLIKFNDFKRHTRLRYIYNRHDR